MPKFAEFFAGIGLVRKAIEPLGWECAFANDISPKKAELYERAYGGAHLKVDDINNLPETQLPPDIDLFTASFPCIDLSLAGNRNGIDGRHSSAFWPFLRLLRDYGETGTPKAVLLENVVGMLTSNGGLDLSRIVAGLNELGYTVDVVVVDAKWFVPQSRPRVFVIGLLGDDHVMKFPIDSTPTRIRPKAVRAFQAAHQTANFGEIPLPDPPVRSPESLLEILDDVPSESSLWWPDEDVNRLLQRMNPLHRERVDQLADAGGNGVATMFRRVRSGRAVGEVRVDGVAGCLRTPVGGSSIQFLVDARGGSPRVRRMTAREYARLQGAGDFPIEVSERQAMYGFGDAVCVPAVRWLVQQAMGHLVDGLTKPGVGQVVKQPRLLERKPLYATDARNGSDFRYANARRRDPLTVSERSAVMKRVKGKNTAPEMSLRKALWAKGDRYRLHAGDLPGKPDIVFRKQKIAVFVDGEFWHGKKLSSERLAEMKPYWRNKIGRNIARDAVTNQTLVELGWRVVRFGEKSISRDLGGVIDVLDQLLLNCVPDSVPAGTEIHLPDVP